MLAAASLVACSSSGSSPKATSSTSRRKPVRTSTSTSSVAPTTTTPGGTAPAITTPGAPSAGPSPTPTPSDGTCGPQITAITGAVLGGDLGPVPVAQYDIVDCRIAPANPIWGAVSLAPKPGTNVTPLIVALERIGSIWSVRAYATDHVACDAPAPVPAQLRLGC